MDGRFPTAEDFDMASTLLGADTIRISSKDSLWARRGWDTSAGVVVVVGVALKSQNDPYAVILTSAATAPVNIARLGESSVELSVPQSATDREYS